MNSLSYLSRQFEVLASPRTPPSTPVSETNPFDPRHQDTQSNSSFKRNRTWSTKSFLSTALPDSSDAASHPKRSYSSPSGFRTVQSLPKSQSSPPVDTPLPLRPVLKVRSIFRRLFIVRVCVVVWNTLCATWVSWTHRWKPDKAAHSVVSVLLESGSEDSDSESKVEKAEGRRLSLPPEPSPAPPASLTPSLSLSSQLSIFHYINPLRSTSSSLPGEPPASPSVVSPQRSSTADHSSRSSTPSAAAHKTPFHSPKTLVLDLDETLIHSTSKPIHSGSGRGSGLLGLASLGRKNRGAGHTVEVVLAGRSTIYHVYKRPFVDYFLRKVSSWYTLVIFTASMQEYADPVIDWLDAGRGILAQRFFRESCTLLPNGSYTKDLSVIEKDLSRVCLIDNSPVSYRVNEANGIPIEGWTHDPSDEALLDLLPILDSLRFTSDVRRVLGIRRFS